MIEEKKLIELGYSTFVYDGKHAIKYYGEGRGNIDFWVIFDESKKNSGYYKDDKVPHLDMPVFNSTDTIEDYLARMAKAVKAYKKDMKELFGEVRGKFEVEE